MGIVTVMAAPILMRYHGTTLVVRSKFNSTFIKSAKDLGGKWSQAMIEWYFHWNQLEQVRAALKSAYDHDGGDVLEYALK